MAAAPLMPVVTFGAGAFDLAVHMAVRWLRWRSITHLYILGLFKLGPIQFWPNWFLGPIQFWPNWILGPIQFWPNWILQKIDLNISHSN
jgi:hypothetical protein